GDAHALHQWPRIHRRPRHRQPARMDQGRHNRLMPLVALALIASCATAGGEGGGAARGTESGNQIGAPVPEIKVESLGGKKIDVASYRGRVLLLEVWASWCGPCKQELPMLDAMARRLKGQGIDVLAVSV